MSCSACPRAGMGWACSDLRVSRSAQPAGPAGRAQAAADLRHVGLLGESALGHCGTWRCVAGWAAGWATGTVLALHHCSAGTANLSAVTAGARVSTTDSAHRPLRRPTVFPVATLQHGERSWPAAGASLGHRRGGCVADVWPVPAARSLHCGQRTCAPYEPAHPAITLADGCIQA